MALFIQPENQNILWEMVNKIPLCSNVFPVDSGSQNEKQNWFKKIIEEFYKKMPPNISRNDLYKINRDVLSYMIRSLGELSLNKQNTIDRGIFSRLDNIETKKTDYEIRQLQYNNMFEIKKPQAIDFSEKLDDDVITNMNELIENQRKMRELDLQQFAQKPNEAVQKLKVNILEDIPKEVIQPQVLKGSKQVHFDLSEKIDIKSNEFSELKQKMENIDNKINQMFEMLRGLTNTPILINENIGRTEEVSNNYHNVEIIKEIMISNE
jgi:hypothetical protein